MLPFLCFLISSLDVDGDEGMKGQSVANTLHQLSTLVERSSLPAYLALFDDLVDQLQSILVLISIRKVRRSRARLSVNYDLAAARQVGRCESARPWWFGCVRQDVDLPSLGIDMFTALDAMNGGERPSDVSTVLRFQSERILFVVAVRSLVWLAVQEATQESQRRSSYPHGPPLSPSCFQAGIIRVIVKMVQSTGGVFLVTSDKAKELWATLVELLGTPQVGRASVSVFLCF